MTYVGATPTTGDFKKLDSITTSSSTTFNLRQGGVAVYPQSANHCIVSLNGVIQAPIDAFTIVNDTIVFASSLASSDVINFILVLGNVNDIGTPSDDTVSTAKIQANAVNASKLSSTAVDNTNTNSTLITAQTEKSSLVDADKFLISDSAASGALKYVQKSNLGAGQWVLLQTTTLSSTTGNVDFNNVFDSTYKNYVVLGSEIRGDADSKILCRFGTGSTPSFDSTSNYERVVSLITAAGGDTIKHSTTDSAVLVTPNVIDTSDGDASFRMVFPEPQNTSRRLQVYFEGTQFTTDPTMLQFAGTGRCNNIAFATPVTSVRFTPNAGSGFDSGTFKLYGVK